MCVGVTEEVRVSLCKRKSVLVSTQEMRFLPSWNCQQTPPLLPPASIPLSSQHHHF